MSTKEIINMFKSVYEIIKMHKTYTELFRKKNCTFWRKLMTEFNLNKYATQRDLYNEPSLETEPEYEPFLFGAKYIWFGFKENSLRQFWDNIISSEM